MQLQGTLDRIPAHHFERMVAEFAWPENYVTDLVCPPVFVPYQGSKMTKVDIDEYFRANLHEWRPGAPVVVETAGGTPVTLSTAYHLEGEYAYRWKREQLLAANQNPQLEDTGAVTRLMNKCKTGRDYKIWAPLIDEANYTNNSTPADWATPATGTPLVDINAAITTLAGYRDPNTLIFGASALRLAKACAEVTAQFKYVDKMAYGGIARTIADFVGIQDVYVVGGQVIPDYGQTAVDLVGNNVIICYVDPSLKGNFNFLGSEAANTFVVNGCLNPEPAAKPPEEIPGYNGKTLYSVELYAKLNFVTEELGYLLYDVNA